MRIFVALIAFVIAESLGALAIYQGAAELGPLMRALVAALTGGPWDESELALRFAHAMAPLSFGTIAVVGFYQLLPYELQSRRQQKAHPDEPWLWRREWAERHIRLRNHWANYLMAIFGAGYFFLLLPLGVVLASTQIPGVIYTFLGIAGGFYLLVARLWWVGRRWATSELRLATLPGVIGGPFSGVVILRERIPSGTPVRLTLNCERMLPSSSGTRLSTLWSEERELTRFLDAGRPDAIAVPVNFAIPFDCEPTDTGSCAAHQRSRARERTYWTLVVLPQEATDPRRAEFEVPVFRTDQSSSDYREDASHLEAFQQPLDPLAAMRRITVQREELLGGERIRLSYFKWDAMLINAVMCALCLAALVALAMFLRPWPFALVVSLMPGGFLAIGSSTLFEIFFWGATLDVFPFTVDITAGYRGAKRRFSLARSSPIEPLAVVDFKKQNGAWWCVTLEPIGAPAVKIIRQLDTQAAAEIARDWLKEQLNRPKPD